MATLNRLILYTHRIPEMTAFYTTHFGYVAQTVADMVILRAPNGGTDLALHPMGKGRKQGQTLVKLGFEVKDVPATKATLESAGIKVGPIWDIETYQFANLKDPAKNNLTITSRRL